MPLAQGLTTEVAEEKLLNDGPNALTPIKTLPEWIKFLRQMFLGFNLLLVISSLLSFFTYGLQYTQGSGTPPPDNVSRD